jgi:hypothetical protein
VAQDWRCDGGGYQSYTIEVVDRMGYDSYTPDHGVLIAKTKAADASPFIWVIDAFPADIGGIDYVMADGTEVPYTVGDYRQLADSAFHAGTAPKTRNTYVDRANNLAFYILAKQPQRKRLTYTVAVQSLTATLLAEEAEVTKTAGRPIPRQVTKMTFEVTNPGSGPGIYRLKAQRHGSVKARLLNDLIYLEGGQTKNVVVWVKKVGSRGSVMLKAALEQPS